jgi:two-component system, LytTR family, sensor kinase
MAASLGSPWRSAFESQLLRFQLWTPVVPLLIWLSSRYRFTELGSRRSVALQVAVATGAAALHTGAYGALWGIWRGAEAVTPNLLINDGLMGLFIYTVIAVIVYAGTYRENWRSEELRTAQLETQLARAELAALRMQLEPHFLFNTLQAISTLIGNDPTLARGLVHRLADLLRATLEAANEPTVPLREELGRLRLYLEIEQMRFEERLSVEWSIAEGLEHALTPNLVLQPLVENAMKHGIERRTEGGRVKVAAAVVGARLRLTVADNGLGIGDGANREGVGLRNTRRRLENLYGGRHLFELRAAQGGGTEAIIEIPLEWRQ